jgi:hypothetical protein
MGCRSRCLSRAPEPEVVHEDELHPRIGGQALALGGIVSELRRAEAKGDKLQLLDAIVNVLPIATAIAMIVREIHNRS